MDFILTEKEHYKAFIDGQSVEEYTMNKRNESIWGDSLELSVFSQIFQTQINIYHYDDKPLAIFKPEKPLNPIALEFRKVIYERCIMLDKKLAESLELIEGYRTEKNMIFEFNLLYRNGNHYDCLVEMDKMELEECFQAFLNDVSFSSWLKYFELNSTMGNFILSIDLELC